jgi:hypothetical protein
LKPPEGSTPLKPKTVIGQDPESVPPPFNAHFISYSLPNMKGMIKARRIPLFAHVALMADMRNADKVCIRKL